MLLVVFGAGASYDSVPLVPAPAPSDNGPFTPKHPYWDTRPPLANQLFDSRPIFVKLMERFKDFQTLVPDLRRPGISIENKLAEFQEQAANYPPARRELAAIHFYIHFALGECQEQWRGAHNGVTNFLPLLREIERWRFERNEKVCFVTFNYDTMLEDAMAQVLRLRVEDMESYYRWQNYSLFKLHGSIDWGRVVVGMTRAPTESFDRLYQRVIDEVEPTNYRITTNYRLCDPHLRAKPIKMRALYAEEDTSALVLYPALSIPVENKDQFSCPSEHVTLLEGLLPKVTKMITIGWRATEADFLKMLRDSRNVVVSGIRNPISLMVVTGTPEGAEQTTQNLIRGAAASSFQEKLPVDNGFTGLINDLGRLGIFLRS